MKLSIYIITHLFLLASCLGQTKTPSNEERTVINENIDTLIERNNPNSLDLTRHQLFIDTTRTYVYYDRTEKWKPFESKELISTTSEYLNYLYEDQTLSKFDFKDFPRLWIPLRQYQGEFILYDRCDGAETSYGLTDSIFFIFGVHEFDVRKIKRVTKFKDNELEFELENYKNEQNEKPLKVHIKLTERKDIYKLTHNLDDFFSTIFVTPNDNVRNFEVLINHCPINKVLEFDDKLDN